jgi:hypothetical protein
LEQRIQSVLLFYHQVLDILHPVTAVRDTCRYSFNPFQKNTNVSLYMTKGTPCLLAVITTHEGNKAHDQPDVMVITTHEGNMTHDQPDVMVITTAI